MPATGRRLVAGAPPKTALTDFLKRAKPPPENGADVGNPLRSAEQHLPQAYACKPCCAMLKTAYQRGRTARAKFTAGTFADVARTAACASILS
ncbi:hypothetical protein ABBQ38_014842 [Trebouxia sp. C0009 RCD-2024]